MKPSEFFTALLHFFNDFIGMTAPGFVLLVGIRMIHSFPMPSVMMAESCPDGADWLFVVIVSYTAGHAMLSLYQLFSEKLLFLSKKVTEKRGKSDEDSGESESYRAFEHCVKAKLADVGRPEAELTFSELRAVAMSKSLEAGELGRRFKFIELFCNGIGTGLLILLLSMLSPTATVIEPSWGVNIALSVLILLLFYRGYEFSKRARNIPFSVALTEVLYPQEKEEATEK